MGGCSSLTLLSQVEELELQKGTRASDGCGVLSNLLLWVRPHLPGQREEGKTQQQQQNKNSFGHDSAHANLTLQGQVFWWIVTSVQLPPQNRFALSLFLVAKFSSLV